RPPGWPGASSAPSRRSAGCATSPPTRSVTSRASTRRPCVRASRPRAGRRSSAISSSSARTSKTGSASSSTTATTIPRRALARCLVAAAALGLTVSLTLVAVPRTRELTGEFTAKIRLHNQGTYTNHVGLGSLIAFHTAPWVERPDGSVFVPHEAALAARPAPWVLPMVSVLYLLVALPLILKARPLESVMYAVPLVFCALSPAGYYYSFLVLLVLLPWR